jgi:hypothetical protein
MNIAASRIILYAGNTLPTHAGVIFYDSACGNIQTRRMQGAVQSNEISRVVNAE